jgi:uncharacterized protein YeaO (DUF488 family)
MITLKRVYDGTPAKAKKFLVERLWPRASAELRKWFSHDPAKYQEFRRKYFKELDTHPKAWQPILAAAREGTATLLYSSHDAEHNNAAALKQDLEAKVE